MHPVRPADAYAACMRVTRRSLLIGAAGAAGGVAGVAVAVENEVLPGRTRAYDVLGLNGEAGVVPDVAGGPVRHGSLQGSDWAIFEPPGAAPGLPVIVTLHGAGSNVGRLETNLALDKFLAASGQQFAMAAIDGGRSYWHPRTDGSDTGALVLDAFLPLLTQLGYDVQRPGFLGWSMGGYGALLLATQRVEADLPVGPVVAVSAALSEHMTSSAFDDEADFAKYGLFARRDLLEGLPVRIDCGRGDPFFRANEAFVDDLDAEVHFEAGAHETAYWTRVLPAELTWLGETLSAADAQ